MALDDVIQELIDEGLKIDESDSKALEKWKYDYCIPVLEANFPNKKSGRGSQEAISFSFVESAKCGINILRSLQGRATQNNNSMQINIVQTQNSTATAIVQSQLSLQININIDNSKDLTPEQKQAAKELYKEVETEVQKSNADWNKVTGLLKRSLDYGLKIAPDIIRLAESYYKASL